MTESTIPRMGITMLATYHTLGPVRLAQEVEARGFESLWIPEHSHIPASRQTPFPGAAPGREELPEVYWQLNDQLVTLSMAAAATTDLVLGTSVSLLAQHDPIWLAKQVATLDFHSRGRLELGVGFGWNREEYEAHGHEWTRRYQRTRDAVGLLRAVWTQDEASFVGSELTLEPSWSWPKPHRPVPILLGGGSGPRLTRRLVEWADGWMPIRAANQPLLAGLADIRAAAAEAGRDPSTISVTAMNGPTSPSELYELGAAGVDRVAFTIWPQEPDAVLAELDRFADVMAQVRGT